MAGSNLTIAFSTGTPGPPIVGRWVRGRTLAGDDTGQGNSVSLRGDSSANILRVVVYRYR